MENWRRHFSRTPTRHDVYLSRLAEGVGYSQAYEEVYGKVPDTPREFAEYLHERCYSIRDIAIWVDRSKSVVHRWLNPAAYQKHLASKRKKPKS